MEWVNQEILLTPTDHVKPSGMVIHAQLLFRAPDKSESSCMIVIVPIFPLVCSSHALTNHLDGAWHKDCLGT